MMRIVSVRICLLLALLLNTFLPSVVYAQSVEGTPIINPTPGPAPPLGPSILPVFDSSQRENQIETILAQMSVVDRVGQLFIIPFPGDIVDADSDIAELIEQYRIGGVVIQPQNENLSNGKGVDTPAQIATLINQLQALAYGLSLPYEQSLSALNESENSLSLDSANGITTSMASNIPLIVAAEQIGDNLPATSLRRGFTPLPSQMALGATWNGDLTRLVGQVVGRELRAVGVNMLLGPTLDLVEEPRIDGVGSRGAYSFGGSPHWSSYLGRAYITGVHMGSSGRVATVARHFPGQGGSDRLPDEEIATIQTSLEGLRERSLPPFISVAQRPSSILTLDGDIAATEALMSSHMRYSGLQGSGTAGLPPLSLAPELNAILAEEGLERWRSGGGIMMSGSLGSPALRRYYDPSLQDFPHQRIALDAFLAGNDLLYLSRFSLDDEWVSIQKNIQETILFFQERYDSDADFAARVDESVRRILRLKLGLYANDVGGNRLKRTVVKLGSEDETTISVHIPLSKVLVYEEDMAVFSEESQEEALAIISQVAREAITVLYPNAQGISDPLSAAPQLNDRLVIFTDSRLQRECAECTIETAVGPDELAQIMEQLYGPLATGQLQPEHITSLTFADLAQLLDEQEDAPLPEGTPSEPNELGDEESAVTETDIENQRGDTGSDTSETAQEQVPPTPEGNLAQSEAQSNNIGNTGDDSGASNGDEAEQTNELNKVAKIKQTIDAADWVIFAMLDVNPEVYPYSNTVKRFLRKQGDQLRDKRVIVLALNEPYFLDATEISKLSAYLGIYSKTQPFLESAVRTLFRSLSPAGAPPVDVPGTRFAKLTDLLQPDPEQRIALTIWENGSQVASNEEPDDENNTSAPSSLTKVGDTIRVQAGPIIDMNGHPVPDGTLVNFHLSYENGNNVSMIESLETRQGIATGDIVVEHGGILSLEAKSGLAKTDIPLSIHIQGDASASNIQPTRLVTPVEMDNQQTATPIPKDNSDPTQIEPEMVEIQRVNLASLVVALVVISIVCSLLLIAQIRILSRQALIQNILWAVVIGLFAYVLYGLGLVPGATWLQVNLQPWGSAMIVFIAMLVPLLWLQLRAE